MCPFTTRAGGARFWTAARVGRTVHRAVSLWCPHKCRLRMCPSKMHAGSARYGPQGGGGSRSANRATAAEFPLCPVPGHRLRHCKRAGNGRFFSGDYRLTRTADLCNITIWHHSMERQLGWTKGGTCFRKVKRRFSCRTTLRTM